MSTAALPGFAQPVTISVSQLTAMIRSAIQQCLPETLIVAGEISNFSRPSSGHLYFTLKDSTSEVRCAMWRSGAASLRFEPKDGLAVIATGSVDVYEPRGHVQFYVRRLEPRGIGALELAFRQLRDKLGKEGLFGSARKRPIPRFPRRVAVVTSPTGAAFRDILNTLRRRFACVELLLYPVRVQGDGAAAEIAAAIRAVNRHAAALGGIDVMIVGRGGGSLEDLWAFNEEPVARAIFASPIPIVSAVGHEVDISIADLVADVRAATPTAAAELIVPVRADLLADLDAHAARLRRGMRATIDKLMARLARAGATELFRDPMEYMRRRAQRLDELTSHLRAGAIHALTLRQTRLHEAEVRLSHQRPTSVLARRRERLSTLEHRLCWAQGHANLIKERSLARAMADLLRVSPIRAVQRHDVLLGQLRVRLRRGVQAAIARYIAAIAGLEARLSGASHERVLARGFTMTRLKRTREIIRSPGQVTPGDRIVTVTADGALESNVVDTRQLELFE